MSKQKELFTAFLATGNTTLLTPREYTVAEKMAQGQSYDEVGQSFAVTRERARQIAAKAERRIQRYNAGKAEEAEAVAFVNKLKESNQSVRTVSVDEVSLFPIRVWCSLKNAGVSTLGDIVDKGRTELFRCRDAHIGVVGMAKITEVLGLFGLELPD